MNPIRGNTFFKIGVCLSINTTIIMLGVIDNNTLIVEFSFNNCDTSRVTRNNPKKVFF